MRIGVSLREPSGPDPMGGLREQMQQAANDGFASAWMSNIFGLDALTALAVAGNQVDGIELGTAVVPTYPRHPAALAQQALTTAAACGGRLVLGIGVSHKIVIEDMYGYDFDRPVRHMREYLDALLPLLADGAVDVTGTTITAHARLTTPGADAPPVLLAALQPRMLELAGGLAGGTITWCTGPVTLEEQIVPLLTMAAGAAGRPAPRVVVALPTIVTDDEADGRAKADEQLAGYGNIPVYRAVLDREGAAGPADVAIVGDEDAVGAQISALSEADVTDFVAGEYGRGEDATRTRALLRVLLREGAG